MHPSTTKEFCDHHFEKSLVYRCRNLEEFSFDSDFIISESICYYFKDQITGSSIGAYAETSQAEFERAKAYPTTSTRDYCHNFVDCGLPSGFTNNPTLPTPVSPPSPPSPPSGDETVTTSSGGYQCVFENRNLPVRTTTCPLRTSPQNRFWDGYIDCVSDFVHGVTDDNSACPSQCDVIEDYAYDYRYEEYADANSGRVCKRNPSVDWNANIHRDISTNVELLFGDFCVEKEACYMHPTTSKSYCDSMFVTNLNNFCLENEFWQFDCSDISSYFSDCEGACYFYADTLHDNDFFVQYYLETSDAEFNAAKSRGPQSCSFTPVCDPPCSSHGKCIYDSDPTSSGKCTCDDGWKGTTCDAAICYLFQCRNGGTCAYPYTCECRHTGFSGEYCTVPLCSSPCQNGGMCDGTNSCTCFEDTWTGDHCEIPVPEPTPTCTPECVNGECVFSLGGGYAYCVCERQWIGAACDVKKNLIKYYTHVANIGDSPYFNDGEICPNTYDSNTQNLEGFQIDRDWSEDSGLSNQVNLQYFGHVQNVGDTSTVSMGTFCGTRGRSLRMEGISISSMNSDFNVFYRVKMYGVGEWMECSNGQFCGSRGQGRPLNAIEIEVEYTGID